MQSTKRSDQKGAVLGLAILTALIGSIASYAMLASAMSQAHHAKFFRDRTRARYLAEAGVVIAQQRLLANPSYTAVNEPVDVDGDSAPDVQLTVSNLGVGNSKQIDARSVY